MGWLLEWDGEIYISNRSRELGWCRSLKLGLLRGKMWPHTPHVTKIGLLTTGPGILDLSILALNFDVSRRWKRTVNLTDTILVELSEELCFY